MVKNWKLILATSLIFATGMVTGAVTMKRLQPVRLPGPGQRVEFLRRIEKRLDLSHAQRERIDKILSESQERTAKLWEQIGPRMREEFDEVRKQIRQELEPPQLVKFDDLIRKTRVRRPGGVEEREKIEKRRERPSRGLPPETGPLSPPPAAMPKN
ncbi:MAG: hypothetical protein HY043_10805 [Verrucomicrobia bacterium]|nr:hypothetical protein [Verrucomicrobiota bacterium]